MKKSYLIIPVVILFVLGIIIWVSGRGYIEISVNNPTGQSLTYSLAKGGSDKSISFKSSASNVKKLLPKGSYEVTINQEDKSYFTSSKVSGFFASKKLTASLTKENARTFIGDNPGFCMDYNEVSLTLYSYTCSGSYTDLQIHLPASPTTPSYTNSPPEPDTDVRGVINVGVDTYAMLKAVQTEENGTADKGIYRLSSDFTLNDWIALKDLNANTGYDIKNYQDGFVAYSDGLDDIKYYTSPAYAPQTLPKAPKTNNLRLISSFTGPGIASLNFLLAESPAQTDENLKEDDITPIRAPDKGQSRLLVYSENSWKAYDFQLSYSSGFKCGDRLCMFGNGQLDIYNTQSGEPKISYSIHDVKLIRPTKTGVLIAKEHDILNFNPDTDSGYIAYSLGKLGFCGLQVTTSGFTVCGATKSGDSYALFVNLSEQNTDSIDKKIVKLLSSSAVARVSIFQNMIFISPEAGEPTYQSDSGEYGYDPTLVAAVKADIANLIISAGLDTSKYEIHYTL